MRWEACLVLVLLLAGPMAAAREVEPAREERTTILVFLRWGPENVGMTNFSQERTVPSDALASFPPDVVRTLRAEWRHEPGLPDADVQAASEAVLEYCMTHNARVFGLLADGPLAADLRGIATGARVDHADGLGIVEIRHVPESVIPDILHLPYVANVGHADARFTQAHQGSSRDER